MNTRQVVAVLFLGSLSSLGWASNDPAISTPAAPPLVISTSSRDEIVDFIHATLAQNPTVEGARLAVRASDSLASAAAKPLYNPELEFSSERAEVDTRTIGLSQTLDWSGKRTARKAVASSERDAAVAQYALARQSIGIELLSVLATYQTNSERYALSQERAQVMQKFLALARKRFDTGDMPLVDFNFAKMVYSQARMDNATVAAESIDGLQQLKMLSNQDIRQRWPSLDTQFTALSPIDDAASQIESLPIVQIAKYQVASAKEAVTLRKREQRTDPTIGLTGGEEGDASLFGITLSIPIPIRNSFRNETSAANEQYLVQVQELTKVERRAKARLVSAYERFNVGLSAWNEWQDIGQSSIAQQTEQLRRLWAAGELSTTDYLIQTGQTLDSQDSALNLRHALWQAWFEWLGASGQIVQWLDLKRSELTPSKLWELPSNESGVSQ